MALLRCSVMSSIGGSQLAFLTITDGQSTNYAAPPADTRRVCACTFYLVFKEPEVVSPCDVNRLQGNLSILLTPWGFVNPPPSLFLLPSRLITAVIANNCRVSAGRCRRGMVEPRRLALADVGGPRRTHPIYDPLRLLSTSPNLPSAALAGRRVVGGQSV